MKRLVYVGVLLVVLILLSVFTQGCSKTEKIVKFTHMQCYYDKEWRDCEIVREASCGMSFRIDGQLLECMTNVLTRWV